MSGPVFESVTDLADFSAHDGMRQQEGADQSQSQGVRMTEDRLQRLLESTGSDSEDKRLFFAKYGGGLMEEDMMMGQTHGSDLTDSLSASARRRWPAAVAAGKNAVVGSGETDGEVAMLLNQQRQEDASPYHHNENEEEEEGVGHQQQEGEEEEDVNALLYDEEHEHEGEADYHHVPHRTTQSAVRSSSGGHTQPTTSTSRTSGSGRTLAAKYGSSSTALSASMSVSGDVRRSRLFDDTESSARRNEASSLKAATLRLRSSSGSLSPTRPRAAGPPSPAKRPQQSPPATRTHTAVRTSTTNNERRAPHQQQQRQPPQVAAPRQHEEEEEEGGGSDSGGEMSERGEWPPPPPQQQRKPNNKKEQPYRGRGDHYDEQYDEVEDQPPPRRGQQQHQDVMGGGLASVVPLVVHEALVQALRADCERAQRDAERALAEERAKREAGMAEARRAWDQRETELKAALRSAEEANYSLTVKVQQLTAALQSHPTSTTATGTAAGGSEAVGGAPSELRQRIKRGASLLDEGITAEQVRALERDVASQESLLAAYQKENERLTNEVKQAAERQRQAERVMFEENQRLGRQLMRGGEVPPAQQQQQQAEKIAELTRELDGARREAADREIELKVELDRARQAKKDLEARLAGAPNAAALAKEADVIKELEARLAEREAAADGLRRKVAWYVENQALLSESEERIRELEATVQLLRAALEEERERAQQQQQQQQAQPPAVTAPKKGGAKAGGDKGAGDAAAAQRKIAELQRQVSEMERAMRSKNPNSIPALIRAVRPQQEEAAGRAGMLEERVVELTKELARNEEDTERRVRALRQDHESIKAAYERRIKGLQDQVDVLKASLGALAQPGLDGGSGAAAVGRPHSANGPLPRAKELQRQLDETRTLYQKKVRELEAQVRTLQLQAAKQPTTSTVAPPTPRPSTSTVEQQQQPNGHEQGEAAAGGGSARQRMQEHFLNRIHQLEAELKESQQKVEELQQRSAAAAVQPDEATTTTSITMHHQRRIDSLTRENEALRAQNESLQRAAAMRSQSQQPMATRAEEDAVADLRRQLEIANVTRQAVQQNCAELIRSAHSEAAESVARLRAEHAADVQRMNEEHAKELERARAALKSNARLCDQLKACQDDGSDAAQTRLMQLQVVLQRLDELERQHADRERAHSQVIDEVRTMAALQVTLSQQKYDLMLQSKNAEIERFKMELDRLMADMAQAQMVGPPNNGHWRRSQRAPVSPVSNSPKPP